MLIRRPGKRPCVDRFHQLRLQEPKRTSSNKRVFEYLARIRFTNRRIDRSLIPPLKLLRVAYGIPARTPQQIRSMTIRPVAIQIDRCIEMGTWLRHKRQSHKPRKRTQTLTPVSHKAHVGHTVLVYAHLQHTSVCVSTHLSCRIDAVSRKRRNRNPLAVHAYLFPLLMYWAALIGPRIRINSSRIRDVTPCCMRLSLSM